MLIEVTEFDKHADCIMTLFEVYLEMTKFVDSGQDPNQHFGLFVDTIDSLTHFVDSVDLSWAVLTTVQIVGMTRFVDSIFRHDKLY